MDETDIQQVWGRQTIDRKILKDYVNLQSTSPKYCLVDFSECPVLNDTVDMQQCFQNN